MQNFSQRFPPPARRQAGGTILGVIIGLIVGLGIAVVVATMITKSSLPFTNRQAQPERQAGVSGAGQIADPNKPLYGNKEPARQAAKNFANEAPPENAVTADMKPTAADKATAEKTRATDKAVADAKLAARTAEKVAAKSVDRQADKSADKSADKPADRPAEKSADKTGEKSADRVALARPDSSEEKYIYFLQAGAFREPEDAENAKAKLAMMGFEANISERPSDTGILYRVRVGPFRQLEGMTRARSKLSDNGVDVAVVRTAR
ncbi:MAG: SPOR domain-containing protein [Herminiimonas sp.]|nr:SPOR domain-containing protein [Herminiimonas sp.]